MTFEYLLEPFLVRYFLLDALCGGFLTDAQREKLFFELAEVFCLSQEGALREFYGAVRQPHFQAIEDLAGYQRLCRTVEFADLTAQDAGLTDRDRLILAQKRKAMTAKAALFPQGKNLTRETVLAGLTGKAENGSIDAMTALAYLEYHGIFGCADRETAIRRARLCAKWNDLFGNLFCIAYGGAEKQEYYDTLFTVLRGAAEQPVFRHICDATHWRGTCCRRSEARLMEKAFGMEIIKRGCFDRTFARAAFSPLLSAGDKEKLLLSRQPDAWTGLPFDLRAGEGLRFDEGCAAGLPLHREEELRKILQNFAVAQRCPAEVYRSLLIVSAEEYPVRMYGDMIRQGLAGAPVTELDAGTLTDADFAATGDNVFLRGMGKTGSMDTVFLIRDCQELSEDHAAQLCKVLDGDFRRGFKLFQPAVSPDLSGLRFVLLASRMTSGVRGLADYCDTVSVGRVRPEEKDAVISNIFRRRAGAYGCAGLELEEEGRTYLAGFDIGQASAVLDGAIRDAVFCQAGTITLQALQQVSRERNLTPGRREFGYTGGDFHA